MVRDKVCVIISFEGVVFKSICSKIALYKNKINHLN